MMYSSKYWVNLSFLLALSLSPFGSGVVRADNPIIQTDFTADPAPVVYNDRVYLFTSHDQDSATTWYNMKDWLLFSSADMVNWQHHGSPMSLETFSWATVDAWAGQVVERNGKFYYYVPINRGPTWATFAIGVGVSDKIEGPYEDAIGGPLLANGQFDPTVYIDDDGQAYLYWGNPDLYYVKLNEDMISYSGDIVKVPLTTDGFGDRGNGQTMYQEGPWFYKQIGLYYMVYAAKCCPENIQYSTSPSPTGPWTYGGIAMATGGTSDTNHVGIVEFKGKQYFFYHNDALPGGQSYKRSVCVESFSYGANGTIPQISMTSEGAAQIGSLDPFVRQEAETIAFSEGVEAQVTASGGIAVAFINSGDYIKVKGVDFGTKGASQFRAAVSSATNGGRIELRLDSRSGQLIGTCSIGNTGGWQTWSTITCPVSNAVGKHDLFFDYIGNGTEYLFNVDWWQFS
ncbi:carbohydrate-binding module family 6 protein [Colletotrichum scovillei]|uniref:Carbohydrate-binding module family 6 protein n=1 Tax=Colletotrichum scovillei TaxID=1209932 RepID=A0A9P7R2P6_9PEZI|nr:carbohydrate-binding module family 6 protein [Colletotrichum scovillei]KAG7066153.1 carbohydrate-binding module family 6 protein [Colletotrichum scovillei]